MSKFSSKPNVIFIHGWPVTAHHWSFLAPMMSCARYHAKYITPRGLGVTDVSDRSYDKATIANEILDQLHSENIRDFAIVAMIGVQLSVILLQKKWDQGVGD